MLDAAPQGPYQIEVLTWSFGVKDAASVSLLMYRAFP